MDIYDREVARLTASPELIFQSYSPYKNDHKLSPLFYFTSPNGQYDGVHGCVLQIRFDRGNAPTKKLTKAIRSDNRFPEIPDWCLHPTYLPLFAEWGRHIDKELGRIPPQDWTP